MWIKLTREWDLFKIKTLTTAMSNGRNTLPNFIVDF